MCSDREWVQRLWLPQSEGLDLDNMAVVMMIVVMSRVMLTMMMIVMKDIKLTNDQVEHMRKGPRSSCQQATLLEERQPHLGFCYWLVFQSWDASFMNFVSNMPNSNPPADTKKERSARRRRRRRRKRSWRRCLWRRRLPARRWWSPAGGRRWAGEGRSRQMQGGPEAPGNIYDLFTILNMSNIDKFWDVDINCDNLSPLNGRYPYLFSVLITNTEIQIQKYKYRNTNTEIQVQKHRRLTSNEKGSEEQTRLCQSFLLLHFFSFFSFFSSASPQPQRPMDSSALITTCNRLGD